MKTTVISQRLLDKLLLSIGEVTDLPIVFEIQEDGAFLLVSVEGAVDGEVGERIAAMVDQAVPSRPSDDSWMVVVMQNDEVVDSYSGGNLSAYA